MSDAFVLDSSVALSWFFPDEQAPETDALLQSLADGGQAITAGHWGLEVTNVLLGAERAKKRPEANSAQFLALVEKLPIEVDPETHLRAGSTTVALARKHRLTSYDAAYLELAMRRGIPLATLDKDLRKAAKAEGVPLLPKETR
ncbi:MAG: type II toxin-antitoxin system VapC family toxin [Limisphaerales bacterium]